MSEPVGGYIVVAKARTPAERWRAVVDALDALDARGGRLDLWVPGRRDVSRLVPPARAEAALAHLSASDLRHARLSGQLAGQWLTFGLNDDDADLLVLRGTVNSRTRFLDEARDPAAVRLFAERWVALCEMLHARYGFFSILSTEALEHSLPAILDDVRREDVEALMARQYWTSYLDDDVAQRWNGRTYVSPLIDTIARRASGALTLSSGYNPVVGAWDLAWQARWILASLRAGPVVPGVAALIAEVRQELESTIPALVADREAIERDVERARARRPDVRRGELRATLGARVEARAERLHGRLERMRALWAVARTRPGLVAANQTVAPGLVVSAVAGEGREWVEVSQHDAWALREREQVRPTVPPAVRARELAAAARGQGEWAEEPRVVFYLYHPPDEKLRAHLEAEGVVVEVAPAPVPLLPESEGSAPPER